MKMIKVMGLGLFLSCLVANLSFAQSYREDGVRIGVNEFQDVKGVRVGQASIKGMVSTESRYESNVYWTPNNKKHDLINVTSPMVLIDIPLGIDERHLLQLMYKADIGTFSNYKDQNFVNQTVAFNGDFKLPFGYLNLQESFKDTSDRASTEFTSKVNRNENKASAALGIEINKLAFETGYSNTIKLFDRKDFNNLEYKEDVMSETVFYQLFPKTKALLEYNNGLIKYSKDATRNGDYNQFRTGFKGNLTGKTEGIIKGGYQKRNYDTAGRSGYEGFVAETGVITQFSERTKLSAKYVKSAYESTYSNNNFFDSHFFSLDLDQKLVGRLGLLVSTGVSRNIYPEVDPTLFQKRHDTILNEEIAFKYTIKDWALAKVGYQYREDISSIRSQSYVDNMWTLGFDFKI